MEQGYSQGIVKYKTGHLKMKWWFGLVVWGSRGPPSNKSAAWYLGRMVLLGCPWYLVNGLFHPYKGRLDTSRK